MMPSRRTTFSVWQRLLQVVAGVLALWSMMAAAQAPAAQTAKPAPAAETKAARMLIWEVSRADQPSMKAWIFGTVHVGKAEFYPLPAAVAKAFAEADVLAVEADVTDQGALEKATSLMLYQPPESLVTRLPAPLVDRLRNQCRRLGLPFEALQSVKPFAAAGLLVVTEYSRQGMEQAQGLDLHFIQQARSVSKPIVELEGLVEQARIVTSMSRDDDIAFIDNAVASLESGDAGRLINRLVSAWQAGDGQRLWNMLEESSKGMDRRSQIEEVLMHARNRQMAVKTDALLKSGKKPFVAVGAAHLVGPTGLVKLLGERGYQLRQL